MTVEHNPISRLTDDIGGWFQSSLERQAHEGEEFTWDVTILPADLAHDHTPVLFFTVWTHGAIIGTAIHGSGTVGGNPALATEAQIDNIAREIVEGLRQARSEQLSGVPLKGNGEQAVPPDRYMMLSKDGTLLAESRESFPPQEGPNTEQDG